MVGIIHKVRFVQSGNKKFNDYINYIGRDEATRSNNFKKFSLYNDYMSNPEKSGSLFTEEKDFLDLDETNSLKEIFSGAQKKGSLMWQDVFSFDNKWLEEKGLYDSKSHTVDEEKVMAAVRSTMNELKKKENLEGLVWSASLHYNTDNIHVHIASVEPNPTRIRGKRKPKTLVNMKSKFLNKLLDQQEEYQKINDIIRNNIIDRDDKVTLKKDRQMKLMINNLLKELPGDKSCWNYNDNRIKKYITQLNELTDYYIKNYKMDEYKELIKHLDKQEINLKEIYGTGKYKEYKKNKIDDLHIRMGNSILHELRSNIVQKEKSEKYQKKIEDWKRKNVNKAIININSKDINNIKKMVGKDVDNAKNMSQYKKLQREIENERGR